MKTLFIIRGLPGAGKSTVGEKIAGAYCFSADDFFDDNYNGKFIPSKLENAHMYCNDNVRKAMEYGVEEIAVANTFTREWEVKPYLKLAEEYGYMVHSIIVENTHGGKSIHNVPKETIQIMHDRFEVNL